MNLPTQTRNVVRQLGGCLILSLAALAGGCTQVYPVKVDAMRTPEVAPRRSYHLVASDHGLGVPDPAVERARETVAQALDQNGLIPASRPEWADMIVVYDVTVGPTRLIAQRDPAAQDAAATTVFLPDRAGGSVGECTGTQAPPSAVKQVVVVREKRLSLVAYACIYSTVTTYAPGPELWRVEVSVQDATSSVDALLPVLGAALVESVDRETSSATVKWIPVRAAIETAGYSRAD